MLHSINYRMCLFLKFICIYFFLYYRGPRVIKLFTGLIMYYPLKIKNIVLYCIVYCIFEFPIIRFQLFAPQILHKLLFSNALGDTAYCQEHLKTMAYAKFGGQTKCIMGNSKIENR